MVGVEDYRAVLDCVAGVCAVRADDFEAEVGTQWPVASGQWSVASEKLGALFWVLLVTGHWSLTPSFNGTQRQTRAGGWAWEIWSGVRAFFEGARGAGYCFRHQEWR